MPLLGISFPKGFAGTWLSRTDQIRRGAYRCSASVFGHPKNLRPGHLRHKHEFIRHVLYWLLSILLRSQSHCQAQTLPRFLPGVF